MANKRIGDVEGDVIITGGLLLGGYLLVKNLVPDLFPSIGVSAQDKATLDQQQTTGQLANIFDPNSQAALDASATVLAQTQFPNFQDYLVSAYTAFIHGSLPPTDPIYPTMQLYYALSKALVGHLISGDQDAINSALNDITNQYQVGIIAWLFSVINGIDFWSQLRNGNFTMVYGLNGTDLAAQVTRLNALPE